MVISIFFDSIDLYKTPSTLQIQLAEERVKKLGLESEKRSLLKT
jgi:molybdate transport system ATP-binding protein